MQQPAYNMLSNIAYRNVFLAALALPTLILSQTLSDSDGYTGYKLELTGDQDDSVIYQTKDTDTSNGTLSTLSGPPDVYLNASVYVGEIDITVANLTAKVNIDAQVLNLLQFNAGVDVSINRVNLDIQNVTAKVLLEARLGNLVAMINDTLDSIDLNPIIASLGTDVGTLLNGTAAALGGGSTGSNSTNAKRSTSQSPLSYDITHNILYSVNSYTGNTHTNYILTQTGDIVAQSLHNDGSVYATTTVGSYWHDMTPTGHEHPVIINGESVLEREYEYDPMPGVSIISAIYVDPSGNVVGTKVLSESFAGGTSTIGDD